MSLTIKNVAEAHAYLTELVKRDTEAEPQDKFLSYATKLKIGTIFRKLKEDNDSFVKERTELVQKFGNPVYESTKPSDNGSQGQIIGYSVPEKGDGRAEFDRLFKELLDSESGVEAIKALPVDALGENKLTMAFIMQLQDVGVLETPVEA